MYIVIYGMLHKEFKTKKEAVRFAITITGFDRVEIYKVERMVTIEDT